MTDLERAHEAEGLLASATDLLNMWARESGVLEAGTEADIKGVIDRLWTRHSLTLRAKAHG